MKAFKIIRKHPRGEREEMAGRYDESHYKPDLRYPIDYYAPPRRRPREVTMLAQEVYGPDNEFLFRVTSFKRWNTHEEAVSRAWRRLTTGRPLPPWAVCRLIGALREIDNQRLEELNEGNDDPDAPVSAPVGALWWDQVEVQQLRQSVGDAGYADVHRAAKLQSLLYFFWGTESTSEKQEEMRSVQAREASKSSASIRAAQAEADVLQIVALLRNEDACRRYNLRRRAFMQSTTAAVQELRDAVFKDQAAGGLRLLRDGFPTGETRLRELIKRLPADLRPPKK